jgi:hypothetical protein
MNSRLAILCALAALSLTGTALARTGDCQKLQTAHGYALQCEDENGIWRVVKKKAPRLNQAPDMKNFNHYASDSGWMSFSYPSGWSVIATDRTPQRYLENFAVQPRGQDFTGQGGQVALRIFDPMYIIEEASLPPSTTVDAQFRAFVRALPGGNRASFSTRVDGGQTYLFAQDRGGAFPVEYVGHTVTGGYLSVVALASPQASVADNEPLLFAAADSVRIVPPSDHLNGPETAMRKWYDQVARRNAPGLLDISCAKGRAALGLTFLGAAMMSSDRAITAMLAAGGSFDYSALHFQTIKENPNGAAVRVSGVVRGPDGKYRAFSKFAGSFGSNSFFVAKEQGQWRVCQPVRGGNR